MTKSIEQRLQALEGRTQSDELPSAIAWLPLNPEHESFGFGRIHSRNGTKTIQFHTQEDVDNFMGKMV
jgi:hypothetical protein